MPSHIDMNDYPMLRMMNVRMPRVDLSKIDGTWPMVFQKNVIQGYV